MLRGDGRENRARDVFETLVPLVCEGVRLGPGRELAKTLVNNVAGKFVIVTRT